MSVVGEAKTYKGKLDNGDTMIAVVDEANGMIVIHEYDGTWGASFLHRGEGVSLTDFLLSKDADYLARKLVPSEKWECIDEDATVAAHIKAAEARGLGEDDNLIDAIEGANWENIAQYYSPNPLALALDADSYDMNNLIVYADARWLVVVRDQCIPLMKKMLREAIGKAA